MYKPTLAVKKMARLRKTTRVVQGGQGAGKTIGILMLLINYACHNELKEVTIIQAELSKLKKTAMRDFTKIMKSMGLWDRTRWNKTDSIYEFKNGTYIEFIGLDKSDVGKGFRRDVIYFNELNKGGITLETYSQFASRAGVTFCDFNPDRRFWLHEEVIPDADTDYLTLTFKDNEYLPKSEVKDIMKYLAKGFHETTYREGHPKAGKPLSDDNLFHNGEKADPYWPPGHSNIKNKFWANKWRVYGLGLTGALDGIIFDNYEMIDHIPAEAEYIGTGLDFGYSNDPTAIVDVYKWNGKRILDELCYRTGMINSDIAALLSKDLVRPVEARLTSAQKASYIDMLSREGVDAAADLLGEQEPEKELMFVPRHVIADSAEPKSIEEIRRTGVSIVGATKGADSINYGIQLMQGVEYLVTKRSQNLKMELESYTWEVNKEGNQSNRPIDKFNHAIDGVRYHELETLGGEEIFLF